jgi:phosphate starvation-inducible membrane PsiE
LYIFKIGLIWAVIAMIIWWIILRRRSLKVIQKHLKISFDRNFFMKNLIIIVILTGICFFIKENFLILNDSARYNNILYLGMTLFLYYGALAWVNYTSIKLLIKEIKSLRKT